MRALLSLAAVAVLLAGCSDGGGGGGGDADGDADNGGASSGGSSGASTSTTSPTGGSMPGTGGTPAAPQPVTLEVAAIGAYPVNPAFDPSTASVPAGAMVHVVFSNNDNIPLIDHNWVVDGIPDAGSDVIAPGETTEFDFQAPAAAGTFTFYCSLGDHRDRGMEGTLTVA